MYKLRQLTLADFPKKARKLFSAELLEWDEETPLAVTADTETGRVIIERLYTCSRCDCLQSSLRFIEGTGEDETPVKKAICRDCAAANAERVTEQYTAFHLPPREE